jgi:glycerol kinase
VQWLRDGLGVLDDAAESERLARQVDSTDGVVFVPALTGLGSPHWDPGARGLITGLTRGTTRAHLVRAALEVIAHQVADVVDVLPLHVDVLRVDGGATANGLLMQLQADLLGCPVEVAADAETTGLGAAALAGLATGVWSGPDELRTLASPGARYEPTMAPDEVARRRADGRDAVRRATLRREQPT